MPKSEIRTYELQFNLLICCAKNRRFKGSIVLQLSLAVGVKLSSSRAQLWQFYFRSVDEEELKVGPFSCCFSS